MIRIPGSHMPNIKNRSSKHLIPLTKCKSVFKSMSNEELKKFSAHPDGMKEINRRAKKHAKV